MNLPRSTYYHKSKNLSVNDSEIIARIEAIIEEFPGYGYRRVTYELHRRSIPVNHHASTRAVKENQTPLD
jgi:putative transposase